MGQIRARNATGPFSWKSALLFVLTGAGMIVYFRVEKDRLERKRIAEMSKGVGKPKVGGPFVLKDLEGKVFTEEELKGRYSFVSFLFQVGEYARSEALGRYGFANWLLWDRFTSVSRIAPISAPMSWTRWLRLSTR
jgi:hypothetical protein